MKNKTYIGPIVLLLIIIFLDWEKWKIADSTMIFALEFVGFLVFSLLAMLFVWCIALLIKNAKRLKGYVALLLALMLFVFGSFTFIPVSDIGIKVNHVFNKASREQVVEMFNNDGLTPLSLSSYNLPFIYRLTSHTGKIYIDSKAESSKRNDKVKFYVHCGYLKSSAVIYSADDTPVKNGDFGDEYVEIKKLEPNWYMVIME